MTFCSCKLSKVPIRYGTVKLVMSWSLTLYGHLTSITILSTSNPSADAARNGLSKLINIPHDWITTFYIISYFVIATDSYFHFLSVSVPEYFHIVTQLIYFPPFYKLSHSFRKWCRMSIFHAIDCLLLNYPFVSIFICLVCSFVIPDIWKKYNRNLNYMQ